MPGFLSHFDTNGVLSCFQEFLQGPCPDGQQFILSDEQNDFEIVCVPTNCNTKESRVENICIPVPVCESDDQMVKFDLKSNEAKCVSLSGTSLRGSNLLGGGITSCGEGKKKDGRGECKATVTSAGENGNHSPEKRSSATYGGGKTIRDVCCP